jgi:hypothetical protein
VNSTLTPDCLTPDRLKPHLEGWLERNPSRSVFAVHHEGEWDGGDQLLVGDRHVDVRVCPSELAMREVLAEPRDDGQVLVMLTAAYDLGADILARLDRPRVHRLQTVDALMHIFDVRSVDPALMRERWLIDALVACAPPDGYERAGARELDRDRAWRALLRHRHGIELDDGLEGMLAWAAGSRREVLVSAGEQERDAMVSYLGTALPGSTGILAAVVAGAGDEALALGLIARMLVEAPADPTRVAARTRFEMRLSGWPFDPASATAWSSAAESRLRAMAADPGAAARVRQVADRILEQLLATKLAVHSDYLDAGLRQRLSSLAIVIDQLLAGRGDLTDVASEVARVCRHHGATAQTSAIATMALRLARWIGADLSAGDSLKAAGARYASDYSYADWARTELRQGSGEASLDEVLQRLVGRADTLREEQECAFAQQLVAWATHAATDDSLLGVEHVLGRVVAPLARQVPVLVVVLDGMSHRVADELLEDVVRAGWTELRRATHPERAHAVSVLPSVTALSRTSLLTGELQRGTAIDERRSFAVHPDLVAASGGNGAPLLFHKGDITDQDGWLSATLRSAVAGKRHVVGVVVNAIDDHLARNEQLRNPWSVNDIPPLRWLLDEARDVGRIVVLASDHGHVLEHGSELRPSAGEGGERWRPMGDPPTDGEVAIRGTRVLTLGGACVLAYSERVRYRTKKNGYHGGASAQEVLAPLVVLAPGLIDQLDGWVEAPYDPPDWWLAESVAAGKAAVEPLVPPQPEAEPGEQMALPTHTTQSATADWVQELLSSELFAAQRSGAGRTPVSDERTAQILGALDAHGGRLLRDALARVCGIPVMRLTGTLAALRQVLNYDGYPVLTVDDATGDVKLDKEMLANQFGLTGA